MPDIYTAVPLESNSNSSGNSIRSWISRRRTILIALAGVILVVILTVAFLLLHDASLASSLSMSSLSSLSSPHSSETTLSSPSSLRGLNNNNKNDESNDGSTDTNMITMTQITKDEEEKPLPQQGMQIMHFTATTTTSSSSNTSFGITTTKSTSAFYSSTNDSSSSLASKPSSFSSIVHEIVTVQKHDDEDVKPYHDEDNNMMMIGGVRNVYDDQDSDKDTPGGNLSIMKTSYIRTSNGSNGIIHEKQYHSNYDKSLDVGAVLGHLDLSNLLDTVEEVEVETEDGADENEDEEEENDKESLNDDIDDQKNAYFDRYYKNDGINFDGNTLSTLDTATS